MNLRTVHLCAFGCLIVLGIAPLRAQSQPASSPGVKESVAALEKELRAEGKLPLLPPLPLPAAPARHFTDNTHTVFAGDVKALDSLLEKYEQETGNQFVVWMDFRLPADASLEDYATRVFNHWGIGQKDRNNGILLLVFVADREMRLETGLGMRKVLPDSLCAEIISHEIAPSFKQGDFGVGLKAGVEAVIKATQGKYRPGFEPGVYWDRLSWGLVLAPFLGGFLVLIYLVLRAYRQPTPPGTRRLGSSSFVSGINPGGPYTGGGGSGGGGGAGGGGGGGFSGGGGSSGGGGASGGW